MRQRGFSLLEMAVVIFIISLLLVSFIRPLSLQREIENVKTTQDNLETIRQALIVYAVAEQKLPCPDINLLGNANEGLENRQPDDSCSQLYGYLPWAELGITRLDPWGQRYLYRVDSAFSQGIPNDGLPVDGMRVRDPFDNSNVTSPTNSGNSHITAVFYSCGPNDVNNQRLNTPQTDCQALNALVFSQGALIEGTQNQSFDDYILWLPKNVLLYYLINAGRWG